MPTPAEMLNAFIKHQVPFAGNMGAHVAEMGDGVARLELPDKPSNHNHIRSVHAGALYTLGETAAGVALSTRFDIMSVPFVAKQGRIEYIAKAFGDITAIATLDDAATAQAKADLEANDKADMTVIADLQNADAKTVAKVFIDFRVYRKRG